MCLKHQFLVESIVQQFYFTILDVCGVRGSVFSQQIELEYCSIR